MGAEREKKRGDELVAVREHSEEQRMYKGRREYCMHR